jgi:hypothetical protein
VSTCGAYSTATGANTLDVNGRPSSLAGDMAGLAVPDQLTINGNTQVDAQWSAFGVAEFLTWNRKITPTELREVQAYLTTKYGLASSTPPAPPAPNSALPTTIPLAPSLATGMITWCVNTHGRSCRACLWPPRPFARRRKCCRVFLAFALTPWPCRRVAGLHTPQVRHERLQCGDRRVDVIC